MKYSIVFLNKIKDDFRNLDDIKKRADNASAATPVMRVDVDRQYWRTKEGIRIKTPRIELILQYWPRCHTKDELLRASQKCTPRTEEWIESQQPQIR